MVLRDNGGMAFSKRARTLTLVAFGGALLLTAAFVDRPAALSGVPAALSGAVPPPPKPIPLASCAPTAQAPQVAGAPTAQGDAQVRAAAHRGLTYLARSSRQWTDTHSCFGCHVQAVTLEALSAGEHHRYDVAPDDIAAMVRALQLGVTAGGRVTGAAFQGAAWARYDRWVSEAHTDELLKWATELTSLQAKTGAIVDDDARRPITGGTMQTTFQAAQTWRQAFARTADEKWLVPLRRAETFLSATVESWHSAPQSADLQDLNFAIMGLMASGASASEARAHALIELLLSRQAADGGWSLGDGPSDAFATGQSIYALKMTGLSDGDTRVARGLQYLLAHQAEEGSWRTYRSGQGGAEKGETMWAVLGLVTVDVASIAVDGLADGQRLGGDVRIAVQAADNASGGIAKIDLVVDDLVVERACGDALSHTWATAGLAPGVHVVEVVAENAQGQSSRRRFEVYSGDVYLTHVAANFDEDAMRTAVTLRSLSRGQGKVAMEVWAVAEDGDPKPLSKVFSTDTAAMAGPMSFEWAGVGDDGQPRPRGRYLAKLMFRDDAGATLQTESTLFFHDRAEAQQEQFSEVEGKLSLDDGALAASNTVVELVDHQGRVVQSTRTTEQGNYRFKNVDEGQYRVRTRKQGFKTLESAVDAKIGAKSAASMKW